MNMPFHTVATPVVIAKASTAITCAYPIYACDLSKLEPQRAMQAELKLAALWKASAAAEGHFKGAPKSDPGSIGIKKREVRVSSKAQGIVLNAIADGSFPVSAIIEKTGLSKTGVATAVRVLVEAGLLIEVKGRGQIAAQFHQPGWEPSGEVVVRVRLGGIHLRRSNEQIEAITELMRGGEISQNEMVRRTGYHRSAVKRAIRRMEADGTAVLISGRNGQSYIWRLAE